MIQVNPFSSCICSFIYSENHSGRFLHVDCKVLLLDAKNFHMIRQKIVLKPSISPGGWFRGEQRGAFRLGPSWTCSQRTMREQVIRRVKYALGRLTPSPSCRKRWIRWHCPEKCCTSWYLHNDKSPYSNKKSLWVQTDILYADIAAVRATCIFRLSLFAETINHIVYILLRNGIAGAAASSRKNMKSY